MLALLFITDRDNSDKVQNLVGVQDIESKWMLNRYYFQ